MISTYDALKAAIADWLNRDDLVAVIPTFVSLAEARIARDLRHWRQERQITTVANERYELLPTDWLEMKSLRHLAGRPFEQVTRQQIADLTATRPGAGMPTHYAIGAGRLEFWPVPDQAYDLDMAYVARIPALSSSEPSNWLLDHYPDIILYGALAQAAPYLKDDERIPVWQSLYTSAVADANAESQRAATSGPLKMRLRG